MRTTEHHDYSFPETPHLIRPKPLAILLVFFLKSSLAFQPQSTILLKIGYTYHTNNKNLGAVRT